MLNQYFLGCIELKSQRPSAVTSYLLNVAQIVSPSGRVGLVLTSWLHGLGQVDVCEHRILFSNCAQAALLATNSPVDILGQIIIQCV
jgi:hypothetical protein